MTISIIFIPLYKRRKQGREKLDTTPKARLESRRERAGDQTVWLQHLGLINALTASGAVGTFFKYQVTRQEQKKLKIVKLRQHMILI